MHGEESGDQSVYLLLCPAKLLHNGPNPIIIAVIIVIAVIVVIIIAVIIIAVIIIIVLVIIAIAIIIVSPDRPQDEEEPGPHCFLQGFRSIY